MDGIIGGLLGYLQDPRRTQQVQGIGNALEKGLLRLQESDRRFKELADRAFDPKNPGRIKDKEALKELTDMTMTGLLGFAPAGLTVFHGSPAKFKKFDPTKIGSGEGAQAYGYGHYVAESPDVAKEYQKNLSKDIVEPAKRALSKANDDVDVAINNAKQEINRLQSLDLTPQTGSAKRDQLIAAQLSNIDELTKYKQQGNWTGGSLYKIDLPDEQIAKMLDWDKPLSQQPEIVKSIIPQSLGLTYKKLENGNHAFVNSEGQIIGNLQKGGTQESFTKNWTEDVLRGTGSDLYRQLGQGMEGGPKVSSALRQAGIPGIRYLDQGSRGTGQGTSNFVVFPGNEDLLRILERNNTPLGLLD
jgi:hypothetical protein